MSEWIDATKQLPRIGQTVLTAHEDDIYPVVAFCVYQDTKTHLLPKEVSWMRQLEGPEDGEHQTYEPLLRPPTHWQELSSMPTEEASDE